MKRFCPFFIMCFVFNCWLTAAFAQAVRVPDANLAAVLREALGLESGATITRQALQEVTQLNAQSRDISDLTGLEHASELQRLFLSDNEINDLTPLANLTQLKALGIWDNEISDLTPLANLTQLEALSIWDNEISDLTPLANLTQLNWLDLGINQVSDLTPLRNLTRLEVLLILRNRVSNLTPLRNLTRLEELDFSYNQITDIRPIAGLARLEVLYFNSNQVTNIAPLAELIRLEELKLSNNQIHDVAPLVELKRLKELQLAENPVENYGLLHPLVEQNPHLTLDVDIYQPVVAVKVGVPAMYWVATERGTLHRLTGGKVENLAPSVQSVTGLIVDAAGEKLYWTRKTGSHRGEIQSTNLDGTNIQLVKRLTSIPYGIALDPVAGRLYFTTSSGKIGRMDIDGSNNQPNLIIDLESPMDIALDVASGKVYWTQAGGNIGYANLDGTNVRMFTIGDPVGGIAVAGGKVYWTEKVNDGTGRIWRANPDGTNVTLLRALRHVPEDIAVDSVDSKMYWTDTRGRIRRTNFNGRVVEDVVTNLPAPVTLVHGSYSAADVNQDGTVNITDLKLVAIAILAAKNSPANPRTDIDGNGTVEFTDLLLVIAAFDASEAAGAPVIIGKISALDPVQIQALIEQLLATNNDSLAMQRTLAYLQNLLTAESHPAKTKLLANYPNPFNPETWIPYQLAETGEVVITIYDTRGSVIRRLELGHQREGYYTSRSRAAYWDGRNDVGERVASGIYFYQLQADNVSRLRKMLILK